MLLWEQTLFFMVSSRLRTETLMESCNCFPLKCIHSPKVCQEKRFITTKLRSSNRQFHDVVVQSGRRCNKVRKMYRIKKWKQQTFSVLPLLTLGSTLKGNIFCLIMCKFSRLRKDPVLKGVCPQRSKHEVTKI